MRVPFASLFKLNGSTIEPIVRIRIGGVTFGPGFTLSKGMAIGGVDLTQYSQHELEVEVEDNTYVIRAIY